MWIKTVLANKCCLEWLVLCAINITFLSKQNIEVLYQTEFDWDWFERSFQKFCKIVV